MSLFIEICPSLKAHNIALPASVCQGVRAVFQKIFLRQYGNTGLRVLSLFGTLVIMKVTIQIPDDLYREVKAKSALEGRSVRSVTMMLYTSWLRGHVSETEETPEGTRAYPVAGKRPNLACFGVGRRFVRKNADGPHDMASIRESIAAGRVMP